VSTYLELRRVICVAGCRAEDGQKAALWGEACQGLRSQQSTVGWSPGQGSKQHMLSQSRKRASMIPLPLRKWTPWLAGRCRACDALSLCGDCPGQLRWAHPGAPAYRWRYRAIRGEGCGGGGGGFLACGGNENKTNKARASMTRDQD